MPPLLVRDVSRREPDVRDGLLMNGQSTRVTDLAGVVRSARWLRAAEQAEPAASGADGTRQPTQARHGAARSSSRRCAARRSSATLSRSRKREGKHHHHDDQGQEPGDRRRSPA